MSELEKDKACLLENGFVIINDIYSQEEVNEIISAINAADKTKETFRRSTGLFAIRQFLKEVPQVSSIIFNDKLKTIVQQFFGKGYFVVKSIYFDKPGASNWYVSYHQDLTISVDKKVDIEGFGPWTVKQGQFGVQPPLPILRDNFTLRIHLDDADKNNGALKVIPRSHLKGIYRPENIDWVNETEITCSVLKGGLMIMKPLLLHSSGRTVNQKQRRVIHIEFSNHELPEQIKWSERHN